MSLLYDSNGDKRITLSALWTLAHKQDAQEADAMSFWQHLFSKHEFKEEFWICGAIIRLTADSRRRIDRGIRFVSTGNEVAVLCWHEAKSEAPEALRVCEEQALEACRLTLENHPWQTHIYALTTVKTKGKAWTYERGDRGLIALHDEGYIEANSAEGVNLRMAFEQMKRLPPAEGMGMAGP